jgi:ABC-2 type transport system permease protein
VFRGSRRHQSSRESETVIAVLVGTGVGYLAAGYFVFDRTQRLARRRGVMGHY